LKELQHGQESTTAFVGDADGGAIVGAGRGAIADAAEKQRDDDEFADGARSTSSPGFGNLLRVCALVSSHGLPKSIIPAIAHIVVEAGGDVGTDRHHRNFGTVFDTSVFKLCMDKTR